MTDFPFVPLLLFLLPPLLLFLDLPPAARSFSVRGSPPTPRRSASSLAPSSVAFRRRRPRRRNDVDDGPSSSSSSLLRGFSGRPPGPWDGEVRRSRRASFASSSDDDSLAESSFSANEEGDAATTATPEERAKSWIRSFSASLVSGDVPSALSHFSKTGRVFWRDMVAFTWNVVTFEGRDAIRDALEGTVDVSRTAGGWNLDPLKEVVVVDDAGGGSEGSKKSALEFWCRFETTECRNRAHVRLDADGAATTLLTAAKELKRRPFAVGRRRPRGLSHGARKGREYWHESRRRSVAPPADGEEEERCVVVVGGGQGGLSLASRLRLLSVPYVCFESGPAPGAAWRNRYPSLHLHDPCYYNHMPYLPFPESWPLFCPRDKIADWLEFYAKVMDLNVRTRSKVVKADRLDDGRWRVHVVAARPSSADDAGIEDDDEGRTIRYTVRADHVVFATGNSSRPRIPPIPGTFLGPRLHSSSYRGGKPFANKRVVVIGSNNSAFDVAQDLWERNARSVTVIQRSPSMVVSTESVLTHGLGPLYEEGAKLDPEEADWVATTVPYRMALDKWKAATKKMSETDEEMREGLIKAGYRFEYGPAHDGERTGLFAKSATVGGGFYIDVGCADLVIDGEVDVRCATVDRFERDAVVVCRCDDDGREERLPADAVIYATGYETLESWVSEICGPAVASDVGKTWGLGLGASPLDPPPWEGELRNMWKPTNVKGLWFQGGNLAQCRHYSRFLALQLAARFLGLETRVYGTPEPAATIPSSRDHGCEEGAATMTSKGAATG